MKTLRGKTNNKAFDNLLRSRIGRPSGSVTACPEFDADLANGYVEHRLTAESRSRYEKHLSECGGCRVSVVALARMAEADTSITSIPAHNRKTVGREPWLASLRAGLAGMANPRWAVFATAVAVIAISIPVLVLRNQKQVSSPSSEVAEVQAAPQSQSQTDTRSQASGEGLAQLQDGRGPALESRQQPATAIQPGFVAGARATRERALQDEFGAADSRKQNEQPATGPVALEKTTAEMSEAKKLESAQIAKNSDDAKAKADTERTTATAPATAAPEPAREELARINKDSALRLPPEEKHAAKVTNLKHPVVDAGDKVERDKLATITPGASVAPPKPRTPEDAGGVGLAQRRAGRALIDRDNARADRAHSPGRKVGKKSFWLLQGVWTDSDYDSTSKLAVVTVVRDSDVYKELLEKNHKLRVFLDGFTGNERAIIVFKNTVYKLIPQSDSR